MRSSGSLLHIDIYHLVLANTYKAETEETPALSTVKIPRDDFNGHRSFLASFSSMERFLHLTPYMDDRFREHFVKHLGSKYF